ncbi:MAG: hypothetical protein LBV20_04410 [Treponema sp.]|jgi:hypothetical protein|nr:hypothetical protein [Treponema sp.]
MKRLTAEERYQERVKKQQKKLEDFAEFEIGNAQSLLEWYQRQQKDMPDDEYRAVVFFKNKEYLRKAGSLTLLYKMYLRCLRELPRSTKELVFDLMRYRYKVYCHVLEKGGFS